MDPSQELQAAVWVEADDVQQRDMESASIDSFELLETAAEMQHEACAFSSTSKTAKHVAPFANICFNRLFNFTLVFFSAEGMVFTALKEWFMQPGSWFEHRLAVTNEDPGSVDGMKADKPLILEDTGVEDFRVFYPQTKLLETYDEWLGVLRLATRWNFPEIRDKAIAALEPLIVKQPANKIHLGTELRVKKWLTLGLEELVTMDDLSPDQLSSSPFSLEWATVAKVLYSCMIYQKGQRIIPNWSMRHCCWLANNGVGDDATTFCSKCAKKWDKYIPRVLVQSNFTAKIQDAGFIADGT
ncbi:hypothetical protein D9619_002126 [Psilocybe cf. subviscida]|uniref:BTB domain-containing protein n=1 Tax=Psilocybe cf. subviscida TaxID=2480587 RepID=A0A8H5BET4_9AGAR|nr:hypothetical protein D9619_002126 [Psilocybe cf. subviscida]